MTSAEFSQTSDAIYFDGRSNRKRSVTLRLAANLEIVEVGTVVGAWPFDAIRRADGPPELLRLSCVAALPLARLEIAEAAMRQALSVRCVSLDAGRQRHTWRIAGWSLAAVVSVLVLALYGVPLAADRLAPLVPNSLERRLGEAVDKQVRFALGGKVCTNREGQAAFAALVGKLQRASGIDDSLNAQVISTGIANAFALPGGKIYLTNGLLQKAQGVDEIAGIIAHELGHVRNRDSLRHLIQAGGTSFLAGLLFGDVIGGGAVIFATQSLLNASYSREAERNADASAIATLRALGRSPKPAGVLLLRVTGTQANRGSDILASHPLTEERLAAMAKADGPNTGADILSTAEWQALKNICSAP